jgi:hypothetical protein
MIHRDLWMAAICLRTLAISSSIGLTRLGSNHPSIPYVRSRHFAPCLEQAIASKQADCGVSPSQPSVHTDGLGAANHLMGVHWLGTPHLV